ncbi:MAG TPA: N-acetyl-gamma-glutamyl-phosphate reductase [Gemmatimonadales bacterium]|nr:N-acetyl-gamma-glutamyl-phosphate reductase [Gemmatimonadales bacterium]
MRVSVIGAAGYAGGELLRLLHGHPEVKELTATSRSQAGKPLAQVHPGLAGLTSARFAALSPAEASRGSDVVFLALEHGESSRVAGEIFAQSPGLVVDLAADFRVRDRCAYERHYGPHPAPELLDRFQYGLADISGAELRNARAIAVPGCFATAAQLALYPLAAIEGLSPSLFAITGSSGSGVQPKATTHHPARANNLFAYSVLSHRHEAEVGEQWRKWTGAPNASARLMTHSGPFVRGIHLTLHARAGKPGQSLETAPELFTQAYASSRFVRMTETPPELTHVVGTNNALIYVATTAEGDEVQVCVVIDNLIKGASGQAVQAMNLALGFAEDAGLQGGGIFPC